MAHKTLISGTAYSVTGGRELIGGTGYGCKAGKTIIDGTAYSVVATREVENTVVVSGVASSSAGSTLTLNDDRFDWDKYKVKKVVIVCKANATFNNNDYRVLYAVYENDGAVSYGACFYGYIRTFKLSIDATTNGTLKVGKANEYDSGQFASVNYTIVLEAKT
jgi:hypothetical protein